VPVIRVDGHYFKSAGDVSFGQPGSSACEADEGCGMAHCCVLHGVVCAGDEAVDAWG